MVVKRNTIILQYIVLIGIGLTFLLPLLWLFLTAFDGSASQALKVPAPFTLENFKIVLSDMSILQGFLMSFVLAGSQTLLVTVISLLAAYPLSRYGLKKAQNITFGLLFLTAIPMTAVMVPVYQQFIMMGLVDSVLGTILFMATTGLPYGIWMTKNFYDTVAVDLEEAAWLDGATAIQSMWKVVLPLMKPGLFTVSIYTFVRGWGNFFVPFILLQTSSKLPASVKIYRFFGDRGEVDFGPLCVYSIMYMLPAILLYSFAQNYMSKGFMMSGSSKG